MKTARKKKRTAVKTAVVKIPQPNGGALYSGGVPGNVGNPNSTGVVPSAVRAACRLKFNERIPRLADIADAKNGESTKEQVRAIQVLAQYAGLERSLTVKRLSPDVQDRLRAHYDWLLNTPLITEQNRQQAIREVRAIWEARKS